MDRFGKFKAHCKDYSHLSLAYKHAEIFAAKTIVLDV